MRVLHFTLAVLAAGLLVEAAAADRVVSQKVEGPRVYGARPEVYVPYTTNGTGNLGVAQGVAPIIYGAPGLGNTGKPVYNLIFYGSRQWSNSGNTGAMPGEPNHLRPNR